MTDEAMSPLRRRMIEDMASPFGLNDPIRHRISADQCARSKCSNSHTAPAAPKSP